MSDLRAAVAIAAIALLASIISVELSLSVAIVEIVLGVVAANLFHLHSVPWLDFVAAFGSIVLTFLAGAEVDVDLLRAELRGSLLVGGVSFAAPFCGAVLYTYFVAGWSFQAAEICGIALSTTSLAVVYAVLVETGLNQRRIGKLIMSATFVTDFGTAGALSILFIKPNLWFVAFVAVSVLLIWLFPKVSPWFFRRYGERVIEPEIKLVFFMLFCLMLLGKLSLGQAVLPAFVLGLAASRLYEGHRLEQQRLRVVAFAFLTPAFFIKGGMNVSLAALGANLGLLGILFAIKQSTKIAGIFPLARGYVGRDALYLTLLMSTGLTFGTISSQYGYQAGIIDKAQFSLLITVVIASAVIPTFIAQRWFQPGAAPGELERRVSPMPRPTADEPGVSEPTEQEGA
jgi:Kef-type K+ transport system membrane component KefB